MTAAHADALGDPELAVYLGDEAWCALVDGAPVAAGGIFEPYWTGRGHCWFARREEGFDRRWWPQITTAVKAAADRALASGRCRRIEMTVHDSDDAAKRWAERLGFAAEAKCAKLMQNGSDGWIYARTE